MHLTILFVLNVSTNWQHMTKPIAFEFITT